jgi:LacI family trehalose operon transcriptional repressor
MQNRLTIKDIARLSGVGKSTVSRVLNNESGVNERTRERVEAVMQQHGFSPSRSARAMRVRAIKWWRHPSGLAVGKPCRTDHAARLLRAGLRSDYDGKPVLSRAGQRAPGMLARRNIDGVVLFGFTGISEEMLTPWRESMVLLARDAPGSPPSATTTTAR